MVLTDELVALAERDEELVAVLAHEIGHVVHRHGLRQTIQSSMLAISVILLTGDLSSASAFVAALPTALAESRFSREFEREADDYALEYLLAAGVSPTHFARMLSRLEEQAGGEATKGQNADLEEVSLEDRPVFGAQSFERCDDFCLALQIRPDGG